MDKHTVGAIVGSMMFISVGITFITYFIYSAKSKMAVQKTIRKAIEEKQDLTAGAIAQLQSEARSRIDDYRRGLLLISLGIGIAIFSQFITKNGDNFAAVSIIPVLLGFGYLVLWKTSPNDDVGAKDERT